jgi:hypothetical protein
VKWLTVLRDLNEADVKQGGEMAVDGRRLIRFYAPHKLLGFPGDGNIVVWVDPATSLPVRVSDALKYQGHDYDVEVTDIHFDPPLADDLFAWPGEMSSRECEQTVTVYVPYGLGKLRGFFAVGPDEKMLLEDSDFFDPPQSGIDNPTGHYETLELSQDAAAKLKEFSAQNVGRELRLGFGNGQSKEISISAPIVRLIPVVPKREPASQP